MRVAKADLVPTEANLREAYPSMTALVAACDVFCDQVNRRRHRETGAVPAERLLVERERLHVLPSAPYAAALGETRLVNDRSDGPVRVGALLHPTRAGRDGGVGPRAGDELVIVADLNACRCAGLGAGAAGRAGRGRPPRPVHPGTPADRARALPRPPRRTRPARPAHRHRGPARAAETAFLALGPGAEAWLVEAAAAGAVRVRAKMAARGRARRAGRTRGRSTPRSGSPPQPGRFAEDDLLAILRPPRRRCPVRAAGASPTRRTPRSPAPRAWEGFGR